MMDNLRCAAMISAADKLMTSGAVPSDTEFAKAALLAMMTHLNAHAIPKGLPEKDAFAAVESECARIMSSMSPAQIVTEAKSCVAQTPR